MSFLACPTCKSLRLFKNGKRKLRTGEKVQTYICRECGKRFAEPRPQQVSPERSINSPGGTSIDSQIRFKRRRKIWSLHKNQVCAGEKQPHEPAKLLPPDAVSLITQLMAWLEKECYAHENSYPAFLRSLVNRGANLRDPETLKKSSGK